jgi:hypothetical protein
VVGVIIGISLVVVLVIVPYIFISMLQGLGFNLGLSLFDIILFGVIIAALSSAAHIAKPTSAYGPLFATKSGVVLAYLFIFAGAATVSLSISGNNGGGGADVSFGWAALLWIVMVIPAIKLAAALVITVEDIRHPGERLPYDYPPETTKTYMLEADTPAQALQVIEAYVSQLEAMQTQGDPGVTALQPQISAVSVRLSQISTMASATAHGTSRPATGPTQPFPYSSSYAGPYQASSPAPTLGKNCSKCGVTNADDAVFCEGCGNRFPGQG